MTTNLNSLSGSFTAAATYTAKNPPVNPSTSTNQIQGSNQAQPSLTFSNTSANTVAGGADECFYQTITLSAQATGSIDLNNFTDVLDQTAVSFARVKGMQAQLYSISQDATYGTNCSQVNIGGGSAPFLGFASANMSIYNGGWVQSYFGVGTAGLAVTSGGHRINLTNVDTVNTGCCQIMIVGGST